MIELGDALVRWTELTLVDAVRAEERKHFPDHLNEFYRLQANLVPVSAPAELRQPVPGLPSGGMPDMGGLLAAWRALERDFRGRLTRGEFHLLGVRSEPTRETVRSALPGVWAADLDFNFAYDRVKIGGDAWVAVVAVRGPVPADTLLATGPVESAPQAGPPLPPITMTSVRELTDDEVLILLEEHAKRVIDSPDGKLLSPGKLSMMPLVAGKLRRRAELGELLPTQAAEVQWLHEWVKSKVALHHVPTVPTIKRVLGKQYEALKGRSNGEIRKA